MLVTAKAGVGRCRAINTSLHYVLSALVAVHNYRRRSKGLFAARRIRFGEFYNLLGRSLATLFINLLGDRRNRETAVSENRGDAF